MPKQYEVFHETSITFGVDFYAMTKKALQVLIHILAWLVFLSFPLVFFPKTKSFIPSEDILNFICLIIPGSLAAIAFFYFNYYFAIPRFYLKRKYWEYCLIIVVCFVMAIVIGWLNNFYEQSFISSHLPSFEADPLQEGMPVREREMFHLGGLAFRFFNVFWISFGLRIYSQWRLAEQEKIKFQLSFLQAQINPHFLFNILNSIYSLIINKSSHAADAVVKLSSIMRYVISEAEHNHVPLHKEIRYVSNYLELQRLRLADNVKLDFSITNEQSERQITPLILLPFIENAFKHGVSMEEECEISISICVEVELLTLKVTNKKVKCSHMDKAESGMGIGNTMKRLQLLYPGRHTLRIDDNAKSYAVELSIQLDL
ncbi:MAG: histidine kinase [Saprospiraceae bacterium]|nr:histidine kinase [Candidatus Opimibacter iunctus]